MNTGPLAAAWDEGMAREAVRIASIHPRARVRRAVLDHSWPQAWDVALVTLVLGYLSPFQLGAFTGADWAAFLQSPSEELRLAAITAMAHARAG